MHLMVLSTTDLMLQGKLTGVPRHPPRIQCHACTLASPSRPPAPPRKNNPPPRQNSETSPWPKLSTIHAQRQTRTAEFDVLPPQPHARISLPDHTLRPPERAESTHGPTFSQRSRTKPIATMTGRGGGGGRKVILPPMCVSPSPA